MLAVSIKFDQVECKISGIILFSRSYRGQFETHSYYTVLITEKAIEFWDFTLPPEGIFEFVDK